MIKALAQQVAKLSQQVSALSKMRIDGFGRSGSGASGGIVFTRTIERSDDPRYISPKTVVIVQKPTAPVTTLLVREARYTTLPPKKCTGVDPNVTCFYEWVYPDFEAYPPLGKEAIDYDGDEWDGATDPKLNTVFHRCHRENEVWVLDLQADGGGMRPARVTAAVTGASTITVQPVKRSGITWVSDGATIVVPLWGFQKGDDFQTFLGGGTVFDVIPLVQAGGEWYAMQYFWMYAKTPNATITKGDCGL